MLQQLNKSFFNVSDKKNTVIRTVVSCQFHQVIDHILQTIITAKRMLPHWVNRALNFLKQKINRFLFNINSNLWLIGLKNDENCLLSSSLDLDLSSRILLWISITHLVYQLIIAHGSCWIYNICSSFKYTPKQNTLGMCILQLLWFFTKGIELGLSTDDHFSAIP